jgi:asparagine synthase (glutamine-hydrolysing)
MSGIAGIHLGAKGRISPGLLLAMAGELRHRGPEGVGLYLDRGFGMAHTHLSTTHPDESKQPLSNESGRYWVLQAGEIYNAAELRGALVRLGHHFATLSDTEVIVHAYEEWGAASLERLNGDFAFAIWDRAAEELFLARDRLGISPLMISEVGGFFCFASEAKALLRHPAALRELDPLALVEAITLWGCAPDRSSFTGIRELPGGHYLRVGAAGILEERRWWDLPLAAPGDTSRGSQGELTEELTELMEDAVRIRLRAAVPVGTYLSGGLDSSAVTALARRAAGRPLPAFALSFTDRRFDETAEQDRVARALGIKVGRITVTAPEIAQLLPRVVELTEKPTLRTAPVPLLLLSAAARDAGCRVVLTGEGADELFAGYDIFKLDQVRRFWARRPESRLRPLLLNNLYSYLPHDLRRAGALLQGAFRSRLTETTDPLYSHRPRFSKAERLLGYFSADLLERASREGEPTERLLARLPVGFERLSPLKRAQYLEVITFLCGYLLHAQGDRMSMGNSAEGRYPFLDHRVVAFAGRLPDLLQLRGLHEKYLLRKALARSLPPEIVRREKRPYRAPILAALVGPGAPGYIAELTDPARIAAAGIFAPVAISRLLAKCRRNVDTIVSETDEMALVGIISIMLLHEQFIVRPNLAAPATPARVVVGSKVVTPESLHHDQIYEEPATTTPA